MQKIHADELLTSKIRGMNAYPANHPALIFDFGGVLFDWNPHYLYLKHFDGNPQAVNDFLAEIGFTEWNSLQDRGRPFSVGVEEHCARYPQYCELIRLYDTHWEESFGGPIQESVEILKSLHEAGYPLYALSNWNADKFALVHSRYAFLAWFKAIIISGNVGMLKPEPRIFHLTIEHTRRPAAECVVIDDAEQNILAAQDLGCQAILFRSPEQLKADLQRLGIETNNNQ
jgi:2-haloacid dehalogenase